MLALRRIRDSQQETGEIIWQIIDCLTTAEKILHKLPLPAKLQRECRLCLPIIEMVCYRGAGSIGIDANEEAALRLCEYVDSYMTKVRISAEKEKEVSEKYRYYRALIDESLRLDRGELQSRLLNRMIFGINDSYEEAISSAEDNDSFGTAQIDNESSITYVGRDELSESYKYMLESAETPEELIEIADEVISDDMLNPAWKRLILFNRVCDLGFYPNIYSIVHAIKRRDDEYRSEYAEYFAAALDKYDMYQNAEEYWDDMRRRCSCINNQQMAKLLIDYIGQIDSGEDIPICETAQSIIQEIILAAFLNDDSENICKKINDYFSCIIRDLAIEQLEMHDYYHSFIAFGLTGIADLFAARGIEFLETETGRPGISEDYKYLLYDALAVLAECIGDNERAGVYAESKEDLIGLGFRYNAV